MRSYVSLAAILIVAACLRIFASTGPIGADDLAYAELAHAFPYSSYLAYDRGPAFQVRLGIIIPTAASFWLVGVKEWAIAIYPFILSLGGIVLALIAGRMFFSERAGLLGAVLAALLPIDVRTSTLLLPDLPAAFWANIGILLVYKGSTEDRTVRKGTYGMLAGLALGSSWLCKETVLFTVPFVTLYIAWSIYEQRRNVALAAAVALGIGCIALAEAVFYYFHTSDIFYHFAAIERTNRWPDATVWFWKPQAPWSALLARLLRDGPRTMFLDTTFGFVTTVAVLAVVYGAFRRQRSALFVSMWFIYHVAILNFGSHSIRFYMPLPIDGWPRYLYPLLLPGVLAVTGLLDSLLPKGGVPKDPLYYERGFFGAVISVVLALGLGHGLYHDFKEPDPCRVERAIAARLSPDSVLYTDPRTAWILGFFWGYPDHRGTVDFATTKVGELRPGSHILFNPPRVDMSRHYGYKVPSFYENPPETWRLEWRGSSAALYRVAE